MEKSIHSAHYEIFLKTLRGARRRQGLTQEDLAQRVKETQSFVSKCERGERRIDVVELREFCAALGLPLKDFVADFERALKRRG
jgi:transcriptional regulator with XRE-family HTH domain